MKSDPGVFILSMNFVLAGIFFVVGSILFWPGLIPERGELAIAAPDASATLGTDTASADAALVTALSLVSASCCHCFYNSCTALSTGLIPEAGTAQRHQTPHVLSARSQQPTIYVFDLCVGLCVVIRLCIV